MAKNEKINKYCELLSNGRLITMRNNSAANDNPIRHEDGVIAWENPYSVGKTAKELTRRAFDKLKREGRQAANDLTA